MKKRHIHPVQGFSDENLRDILWSYGLKATSPRTIVLRALAKETKPLSAAILLNKTGKDADEATIYRTLSSLAEAGIVKKLDLGGDAASYELSFGRSHHHHAVCTSCGTVEDVSDCEPAELETIARRHAKSFASITSHSLEFFGVCKRCSAK